jgi:hypothetical protein
LCEFSIIRRLIEINEAFGSDAGENTSGWSMMTPAERNQHREMMGTFKTA